MQSIKKRPDFERFDHMPPHKSSIHYYDYAAKDFEMPSWLRVPRSLQDAVAQLHERARIAITSMKQLSHLRSSRYDNMCPPSLDAVYTLHQWSIMRLFDWEAQWDPKDPTLISSPKIPRHVLRFTLDPLHYAKFYKTYSLWVQSFIGGPIRAWEKMKPLVITRASQVLNEYEYQEWRYWWDNTYMPAMWKWEMCLQDLLLPTWEELVDELYAMIIERVEGAEELASSLCATFSPPMTPKAQREKELDDYFLFT
ncbi:hypothetical protein PENDEC_c039G00016 [Penicillium decumbens]|uniref:Uncharacterized protein n=1 Tax=Penicillium decumbens TaxID=69771 RepID=A0A1V6NRX9_PENDC|nr:hypothetical protein PENDEC_c039G00016 [Penicillium decumbens]